MLVCVKMGLESTQKLNGPIFSRLIFIFTNIEVSSDTCFPAKSAYVI